MDRAKSTVKPDTNIEERLASAIRDIQRVKLEADENGHAIVDQDRHPDIYDWARNG